MRIIKTCQLGLLKNAKYHWKL